MDRKLQLLIIGAAVVAALFLWVFSDIIALGIWIFLVWNVRKKNINMFSGQLEPQTAEGLLKRLKKYLSIAGVSFIFFIIGAIMHNVIYGFTETEEIVFLIIAGVAHIVFVVTTAYGFVLFLSGRQNQR